MSSGVAPLTVGSLDPYPQPQGGKCWQCGSWVSPGCTHVCWPQGKAWSSPSFPLWEPTGPMQSHERTLAAAERVREAAERDAR